MQPQGSNNGLKKVLGAGFGIAVMIGGTIGVGILRTTGTVGNLLDNYWLIAACWAFGGIYALLGAGVFAELATMMPKAGGPYNYVKRAFGDYPGFVIGWFDYLVNAIAPAYFCIVIGEYMAMLWPVFGDYQLVVSVAALLFFTLLHAVGIKSGSFAQKVTSLVKVIFFLVLIVSCFVVDVHPEVTKSSAALRTDLTLVSLLVGIQYIMGAYDGWWIVSFFAEEDENPSRNIPRSLFVGVITVSAIYVLFNMAIFYLVPARSMSTTSLIAFDAANLVFGESGATFVVVLAIVSLVSILNAYMMIPPRILFGMSRDQYFIRQGMTVNRGGTPIVSLLLSSAVSLILILVGSFESLFLLATLMSVVVIGVVFLAQIKLREKEPELHRPFRAWAYPFTTYVLILISVALLIGFAYGDPVSFSITVALTGLSYLVFLFVKKK